MMKRLTRVTLTSAGYYCLAFFITQVLHEGGHAAVSYALGGHPILHTSYVDHTVDLATLPRVAAKLAGPLLSLLQGLALLALVRSKAPLGPQTRLMLTWLAYHGLVNFVGYIFTTSFAPGGDLGAAAALLGLPFVAKLALTGVGYAGLRYLARPLAVSFATLASAPLDETTGRAWSKEIGLFAGVLATPVLVLAALPVPHWLSLVYVVAAFLPLFDLPKAMVAAGDRGGRCTFGVSRPAVVAVLYVGVVVVVRVLLDGGVAIG